MPAVWRIVRIAIGIVVGLLLVAAIMYEVTLPEYYATTYLSQVEAIAARERPVVAKLAKTIERDTFYDFTTCCTTKADDITVIRQAIDASRKSIARIGAMSTVLPQLTYSGYTPTYRKAEVVQHKVREFAKHGQSTLDAYQSLVDQINIYTVSIAEARSTIDEFNNVDDINIYVGRVDELRAKASLLRDLQSRVDSAPAPDGYRTIQSSTSQAIRMAAHGYDNLASAISLAIDSLIYTAAAEIESSGRDLDEIDRTVSIQIGGSRLLKDVTDLEEQVDSFIK